MGLTQDVASETRPRRDKPLNYVRVRDETESLGTLGLETETLVTLCKFIRKLTWEIEKS